MSPLPFWKTQTIGNDFVLLHAEDLVRLGFDDPTPLAIRLCERKFGIGSDGLLVVATEDDGLHLRMFNPDGTEDFCGNGLRCAAAHAYRLGWVEREHRIEHFGRLVSALVQPDGAVMTAIGPAVYEPEDVPIARKEPLIDEEVLGYVGSALNAGSTHFVTFVREIPDDDEFLKAGPAIEEHKLFPERTSVIFAVEDGVRRLRIRIWERGVGETLGCGTGSSAAAAEWMRRHGQAGIVEVINPGGSLVVHADTVGGSLVTTSSPFEPFSGTTEVGALQRVRLAR